jgi:hypothetical protein
LESLVSKKEDDDEKVLRLVQIFVHR